MTHNSCPHFVMTVLTVGIVSSIVVSCNDSIRNADVAPTTRRSALRLGSEAQKRERISPDKLDVRIDSIFVRKSARRMSCFRHGKLVRTYLVALGRTPKGRKVRRGDNRTPEGTYSIDTRVRNSTCHLALHISYPNAEDRSRATRLGVDPGGDIMIHGLPNSQGYIGKLHRLTDWTYGCIAVTDQEIEELWRTVPNGTPITIHP